MSTPCAAKERAAKQRAAEKAADAGTAENSQLDDIEDTDDDSQPTSEADLGNVTDDGFSEAPGGIPPPT
ncbi:MAG: hypothetical protein OXG11_14630 [Chloroflexi bacterium]|nr:hypothetical protein [Chloroflexota bacterium]